MNKKVLPNLPNIPITKQSKWSFISRLFKRSPKIPKPSSRKSKSKESKNDNSNLSNIGLMRPQDFSSFLQNNPVSPSNLAKTKRNDNAFSPESLSNRSREIQNPLSKIFENGTLSTPDKKFLKKFTGTIETEELTQTNQLKKNFENSNDDLRRPKKPLDSTRNKAGGLKYRNKLEKFQKNLERKFSFNYREKAIGELVFNLDFFRDILKFLSLESLLNFWFISKKFHSNDYQYMGLIRKQMVYLVSKVGYIKIIRIKFS